MKKIMFILAVMLTFASCSRIVSSTNGSQELAHGVVTKVDSLAGEIRITIFSNWEEQTWKPRLMQDGISTDIFNRNKADIILGDTVFVYEDSKGIYLSKLSLSDAEKIYNIASKEYWNLLFDWRIMLMLIVLAIASTLNIILIWQNKKERIYGFSLCLLSIILAGLLSFPGRTFQPIMSGIVKSANNSTISLYSSTGYELADSTDVFMDGAPICEGEDIYVYAYGHHTLHGDIYYASKHKLNPYTLAVKSIYPNVIIRNMIAEILLILLASLVGKFILRKLDELDMKRPSDEENDNISGEYDDD